MQQKVQAVGIQDLELLLPKIYMSLIATSKLDNIILYMYLKTKSKKKALKTRKLKTRKLKTRTLKAGALKTGPLNTGLLKTKKDEAYI